MVIYRVFERLIRYYSARMCCEDGESELTLRLVELLHKLDLSRFKSDESFGIQKFIAVSLRNRYIDISKKGRFELMTIQHLTDYAFTQKYVDEKIMLPDALSVLSKKQRLVLDYEYFYGYNGEEIAEMMGTTRQAVNGIKQRALNTMKNFYEEPKGGTEDVQTSIECRTRNEYGG